MPTDRTDQIIKKLDELIDLVKTTQPKVENHTHHHYPTTPGYTYTYPYTTPWVGSGGNTTTMPPGITWTTSTNDPNGGGDSTA